MAETTMKISFGPSVGIHKMPIELLLEVFMYYCDDPTIPCHPASSSASSSHSPSSTNPSQTDSESEDLEPPPPTQAVDQQQSGQVDTSSTKTDDDESRIFPAYTLIQVCENWKAIVESRLARWCWRSLDLTLPSATKECSLVRPTTHGLSTRAQSRDAGTTSADEYEYIMTDIKTYFSKTRRYNNLATLIPIHITLRNGAIQGPAFDDDAEQLMHYPILEFPAPRNILRALVPFITQLSVVKLELPIHFMFVDMGRLPLPSRRMLKEFELVITNGGSYLDFERTGPERERAESASVSDVAETLISSVGFLSILSPSFGSSRVNPTNFTPNLTHVVFQSPWSGTKPENIIPLFDHLPLPWNQLVEVELKMVGTKHAKTIQAMLMTAVCLESVKLTVGEWSDENRGLDTRDDVSICELPFLRVFQIVFLKEAESCAESFLRPFSFPRLEELNILFNSDEFYDADEDVDMSSVLMGLMNRSRRHTSSSLRGPSFPLSRIHLKHAAGGFDTNNFLELLLGTSDTLTHITLVYCSGIKIDSLLDALTVNPNDPMVLAPNLTRLHADLGVDALDQEQVNVLFEFLDSRWRSSVNGHTARLTHVHLTVDEDVSFEVSCSKQWQAIRCGRGHGGFAEGFSMRLRDRSELNFLKTDEELKKECSWLLRSSSSVLFPQKGKGSQSSLSRQLSFAESVDLSMGQL